MSNGEIAEKIFKDGNYKALCRSIAKKAHIAEELHSEFILSLLEIKDSRLTEAEQGGYLNVFCVGIIHNIWGKKSRTKSGKIGSTSPLYEQNSTLNEDSQIERAWSRSSTIDDFNIEYRYIAKLDEKNKEENIDMVLEQIKSDMNSNDSSLRYKSRNFYYSHVSMVPDLKDENGNVLLKRPENVKNPKQFAKLSGIGYSSIMKSCKAYKKRLLNLKYKRND